MPEVPYCRCDEGAYLGAQAAGTVTRCERCRLPLDSIAVAYMRGIAYRCLVELRDYAVREGLDELIFDPIRCLEPWPESEQIAGKPGEQRTLPSDPHGNTPSQYLGGGHRLK